MKRLLAIVCLLLVSPILSSSDSIVYNPSYLAKFRSPEGILFLSYSSNWNDKNLEDLYKELIQNKHGEELKYLQEIRVKENAVQSKNGADYSIRARYNSLTSTITLYQGAKYTNPIDYREVLSHEYGHHFSYYHFKSHHFPFSNWRKLRGLNSKVHWDAFWNYQASNERHKWYPQEIFADDYVLLFGAPHPVELKDVYTNEAFYLRTEHENTEITNILELTPLHQYIEDITGLEIDTDRFLETPKLVNYDQDSLQLSVTKNQNVAYRLNLEYKSQQQSKYLEFLEITTNNTQDYLEFSIREFTDQLPSHVDENRVIATIDVLDLNNGIGFTTEPIHLKIRQD